MGWTAIVIWECEVTKPERLADTIKAIKAIKVSPAEPSGDPGRL
jgi:G:T-mismatch repair DNA endonuclease (very short patch repair protein)